MVSHCGASRSAIPCLPEPSEVSPFGHAAGLMTTLSTFTLPNLRSVAVTLLLSASLPVAGAVAVRGDPSCGNWTEARATNAMRSLANEFWLLGFLSALAIETERDFISGTDNPSLFLWMDNYCKENPLSHVSDGGYKLFRELVRRKGL